MKSLLSILLISSSSVVFAQDYMDELANKACACVTALPDSLSTEKRNYSLGICMIEAAMPYKKQIKKDYKLDMNNLVEDGKKLGNIIGVRAATICPDAFIKMVEGDRKQNKSGESTIGGVVSKIENEHFVVISLKDETGKIQKFYWLTFIESEEDLVGNYNWLGGRTLEISYTTEEFFDPKIDEYRSFNIITRLEVIPD